MIIWITIGYLLFVNIVSFITMAVDKSKAKHGKWRISEKTLFLLAAVGGSVGSLAGMYTFRHKTKHTKFVIGMPVILIVHIALAIYVIYNYANWR